MGDLFSGSESTLGGGFILTNESRNPIAWKRNLGSGSRGSVPWERIYFWAVNAGMWYVTKQLSVLWRWEKMEAWMKSSPPLKNFHYDMIGTSSNTIRQVVLTMPEGKVLCTYLIEDDGPFMTHSVSKSFRILKWSSFFIYIRFCIKWVQIYIMVDLDIIFESTKITKSWKAFSMCVLLIFCTLWSYLTVSFSWARLHLNSITSTYCATDAG